MSVAEDMPRPRRRWVAVSVVCSIALASAGAMYAGQALHHDRPAETGAPAHPAPTASRERETQSLLGAVNRAVATGDGAAFRAGWAGTRDAQGRAAGILTSLSRLDLASFELRV